MEFTIEKNTLVDSLNEVIRAIDITNIYTQLRNFYIEVLDEMIIIRGSNGYFSIEDKIEGNKINHIKSIGNFLVPASIFINVVKKCNGLIQLKYENNILNIQNEDDKYEINLMNSEDFVPIDFSLYGNKLKVNAIKLRDAINNVIFATAQTNEEIILTGVNIRYENGKLFITATDSFRLAREVIDIDDDRQINFDVTITNKNIKNFIPSNIEGDVTLYVNENKINLIYKSINFQSKIIEAPYKNVSKLFEFQLDKKITISKSILNNAISKATVMSNLENSFNKIYITFGPEQILLSTNADEIGRTNVVIKQNDYEINFNEEITLVLNYKFLKEAISVFNDKIKINMATPKALILIESEDSTNKQIISPMVS